MTPTLLRRVFSGYASILKPVLFVLAMLAVSAALSFAVAWPLWFFATKYRLLYSVLTLAAVLAAVVVLAVESRRRRAATPDSAPPGRRRPPAFALLALLWILVLAAGLYAAALTFVKGRFYIGAPLLALLLFLLGLAAWAARRKKQG
jgi:drug/metabolite transporter (DMT)-like permease